MSDPVSSCLDDHLLPRPFCHSITQVCSISTTAERIGTAPDIPSRAGRIQCFPFAVVRGRCRSFKCATDCCSCRVFQEYYLHALSQPREHPSDSQLTESDAEGHHPAGALETMFGITRSPFSASNLNALSRRMSHAMVEAVQGDPCCVTDPRSTGAWGLMAARWSIAQHNVKSQDRRASPPLQPQARQHASQARMRHESVHLHVFRLPSMHTNNQSNNWGVCI